MLYALTTKTKGDHVDTIYDQYEYVGKTSSRCKKWVGPNGHVIKNRFPSGDPWLAFDTNDDVIWAPSVVGRRGFDSFEGAVAAVEAAAIVEPDPSDFDLSPEELAELSTIDLSEESTDA